MEKQLFSKAFGPFCIALTMLLALFSCSADHLINEDFDGKPALLKGQDKGTPYSECEGEYPYEPNLTALPLANYPGYDLAVLVTGYPDNVPVDCQCSETTVCLQLGLAIPNVLRVGIADSQFAGQGIEALYQNPGGFTSKYLSPIGLNENPVLQNPVNLGPFSLCFDTANGDILLFDFMGNSLEDFSLEAVIDNAGGICIIDNIDNPNG